MREVFVGCDVTARAVTHTEDHSAFPTQPHSPFFFYFLPFPHSVKTKNYPEVIERGFIDCLIDK